MKHSVRLEVIQAELLDVDRDVQFDFALSEKRWRSIGANWDPAKQGVLEVTPEPNGSGHYSVFDGRHRLLGGRDVAGVKEFRCDVHRPTLSPKEKAERKLGLDRDRRRVKTIESFLASVIAEDPEALAIRDEVEEAGYIVGWSAGKGTTPKTIEAVSALAKIYRAGLLPRVLNLNTLWLGELKTNQAPWLWALSYFCREGYDENLSGAQYQRLKDLIPAQVWRKAVAESVSLSTQTVAGGGEVARRMSEQMRKTARIKK